METLSSEGVKGEVGLPPHAYDILFCTPSPIDVILIERHLPSDGRRDRSGGFHSEEALNYMGISTTTAEPS